MELYEIVFWGFMIYICFWFYFKCLRPEFKKENIKKEAEIRRIRDDIEKDERDDKVLCLATSGSLVPLTDFLNIWDTDFYNYSSRYYNAMYDFVGVYIIINETKKKYYIGYSDKIIFTLHKHFRGMGNGLVYLDYTNGDEFNVGIRPLMYSEFSSKTELKHSVIKEFEGEYASYSKNQ